MKKISRLLLLVLAILLLSGCGKEQIPEGSMVVYHLNKDETAVVPVACEITGDSVEIKVEDVPTLSRYDEMMKDLYLAVTGEKKNPYPYEHELIVQRTIYRATGEII